MNNETGYLTSKGNYTEMSEKINLLISDTALRKNMGENAFLNSKNYDMEMIVSQWIQLFNNLLKKKF